MENLQTGSYDSKYELWIARISFILIALSIFTIPFGTVSQGPCALLAFCGIAVAIVTRGQIFKDPAFKRFALIMLCYAVPIMISIIGSVKIKSPSKVLTMALLSFGGSLAVIYACKDEKNRKRLLLIFSVTVGFWMVDCLFQFIVGHDIFGHTPYKETRYGGPFSEQWIFGIYLALFCPFLLFLGVLRNWKKWILFPVFLLTGFIELIANTRTGWVMFALVSLVFIYQVLLKNIRHRIIITICIILAGSAIFGGLYKTSPSFSKRVDNTTAAFKGNLDLNKLENALSGRLGIWITAVNVIKDHPINGIGARNFREVYLEYRPEPGYGKFQGERAFKWVSDPHQLVLEVGVGTGFIGIIGLLGMYILFFKTWKEADKKQRTYGIPFATMLLAAYFPLNTHNAHYGSQYALILWLMIALFIAFLGSEWSEAKELEEG